MAVKVIRNVEYVEKGDARHRLEFFAPQTAEPFPVLLFVSGGGWAAGSRHWIAEIGEHFSTLGFGVALVDHRLAPQVTPKEQAQDVAAAFEWIVAHAAEHGGDPSRIIVGGHSAGAHLVALMLTGPGYLHERDNVRGMVSVAGAMDTRDRFASDLSPAQHVRAGLPPFLLITAEDDLAGIPAMNDRMLALLSEADVAVEAHVIAGTNHFDVVTHPSTIALMERWMRERVEAE